MAAPTELPPTLADPPPPLLNTHEMGWEPFERLVLHMARTLDGAHGVRRYGRPGQAQHGLDVVGFFADRAPSVYQAKEWQVFGAADLEKAVELYAGGRHRLRTRTRPPLRWSSPGPPRAARLGCSFSVNVAMSDDQIGCIPRDRILPETDFPHVRRGGANRPRRPADVSFLETRLSKIWSCDVGEVRRDLFCNLRETVRRAGMMDAIPEWLTDLLLAV
jgi:hypothetical protein